MIQAAHIGVGLYGQEGMRAVQAADFAIPEFKALWRLLFVHGRWCYIRIAEMVLYFFYKNMVFTLPLFYFCFVSAFSGQTLFDSWYISLYNTIFTLLPVVAKACFEQDVYYKKIVYETQEKKKVLKVVELTNVRKSYPLLYSGGVGSKAFSLRKFFRSVNKGAFHSVIIFVLTYFSLDRAIVCSDGQVSNFWYFSITVFTSVVLVVDLKLAIYTRYWTVLMWVALIITSIGLYIAYIWFGDTLDANPISRTAAVLFSTLHFYLIVLMNLTIVLLLETMYIYIKKEYDTEAADFIVSLVKNHNEDDQTKFDRIEKEILLERKKKSQASPHKLSSVPDFNITKSEKLPNNRGVTINLESSPSPLRRPSIDQLINKFSGHQRRNSKSSPQNRLVSEDGLYKDTEEGREGQTNLQNGRHFAHSNQQKPEDTENKMTEQINSTHSIGRSPNDISLQGSIAEERPTSRIFSQLFSLRAQEYSTILTQTLIHRAFHNMIKGSLPAEIKQEQLQEINETKSYASKIDADRMAKWKQEVLYKSCILNTNILPCKVFLMSDKWKEYLAEGGAWGLSAIIGDLERKDKKISMILDLNRSFDYYNFEDFISEYPEIEDIKYTKLPLDDKKVPNESAVQEAHQLLDEYFDKEGVIVVHCINGRNRTGYILCSYLCKKFSMSADGAMALFTEARGHEIEHEILIEHLRKTFP